MPRTTRRSWYLFWSRIKSGISARQGGHQVAQKFTSTTLPRSDSDEMVRPSISVTVKGATVMGSRRSCTTGASAEGVVTSAPSGGLVFLEQEALQSDTAAATTSATLFARTSITVNPNPSGSGGLTFR